MLYLSRQMSPYFVSSLQGLFDRLYNKRTKRLTNKGKTTATN